MPLALKRAPCATAPAYKGHDSSTTPPAVSADAPDRAWAVDFQVDVTTDGWPIKIGSIIDERHL
jgi:hypothetical protein